MPSMSRIVWLASYPKSGNTWVRALVTNYRRHEQTPADINELEGGPIASARLGFDEWVGVEASALRANVVDRLRPEVYRRLASSAEAPLFLKVHDAWSRADNDEPISPADATLGVVYIVRNPLDLAMSLANHYGLMPEQAVRQLCDRDAKASDSAFGLRHQLRQRLGSWSEHVRSWVDESGLPVEIVRYEDLAADAVAALERVVRFSGLDRNRDGSSPARLATAVAFSEFAELSRQERESGFKERPPAARTFFRRGRVDGWREELGPSLVRQLVDAHGPTMERFGYLDGVEMIGDAA
jgi:aryl sulfotransferase